MIDKKYIQGEIDELLELDRLTHGDLCDLFMLYIVRDYMEGSGMALARSSSDTEDDWVEEWSEKLENEDGTTGPHWTRKQTDDIMTECRLSVDPEEFYIVMNTLYADYYKVARKHRVNTPEFFSDMACAWLCDKDAVDDKTEMYYRYVVK